MERWEYAAGEEDWHEYPGKKWVPVDGSEPGTFEAARVALIRLLVADDPQGDYSLHNPCVIKRSERHPEWTPVYDHAAELLVEALEGVRLDFATIGAGIVQGSDVAKIFKKRAQILRNTLPNQSQEYDA